MSYIEKEKEYFEIAKARKKTEKKPVKSKQNKPNK
jgi:hypothetical protein